MEIVITKAVKMIEHPEPVTWDWRHFTNGDIVKKILLGEIKCEYCNEFLFNEEDYIHMLEHEMAEILCVDIIFEDGGIESVKKWSAVGFNNMFSGERLKEVHHKCCCSRTDIIYNIG